MNMMIILFCICLRRPSQENLHSYIFNFKVKSFNLMRMRLFMALCLGLVAGRSKHFNTNDIQNGKRYLLAQMRELETKEKCDKCRACKVSECCKSPCQPELLHDAYDLGGSVYFGHFRCGRILFY